MRIIKKSNLRSFWEQPRREDAEIHLRTWIAEVEAADWNTPNDVKAQFASASILQNSRVCFNIKGNDYRLIVAISYPAKVVPIKFIGTHKDYDIFDVHEGSMF